MGCFSSKPALPPPSSSPAPGREGRQHVAIQDAFQASTNPASRPNTATQAPFSSNESRERAAAILDVQQTAQPPSQAPLPFAPDVPPPPRNGDTAPEPRPPQRVVVAPPSHSEGIPVSSQSQDVAGLTTYPPAQMNMETSGYRTHEYSGGWRAPSSFRAIPVDRSMSAQPLSQWGSPTTTQSSRAMARTMSASGLPSEAKTEDTLRKPARSTHGVNKARVTNDSGHQRFPSIVRTILSDNLRYAA
jgi:hypothetical protein